jgi:cephalosporin-C deacetylase
MGVLISGPEDYGLTAEQTLGHRAHVERPEGFEAYWREVREEIVTLPERWVGSIEPGPNEVRIASARDVRVIARVTVPEAPVAGVVITTHGSGAAEVFPEEPEPWTEHGAATVRLRVRGYPPSTIDVDDLRAGWILHGIDDPDAWILRGAVVDLVQTCRCARRHFGPDLPISLHGESLGGGLAVLAAAQLAALGDPAHRLALGLPSFGDWRWRRDRYCNGTGGLVNERLRIMRRDADALMRTLLLFDGALHAPAVTSPTLCKLALADDVVPAPSAAAVFNALGGERWRFVTSFGHFDGGIADGRRHVLFERIHPVFLDPRADPQKTIARHAAQLEM